MGLFKFFGLEEKEEEKGNIFCGKCKKIHYATFSFCTVFEKLEVIPKDHMYDEHVITRNVYGDPPVQNKNNDCEYFEESNTK